VCVFSSYRFFKHMMKYLSKIFFSNNLYLSLSVCFIFCWSTKYLRSWPT